jgi:plastocyanin
MKPLTLLTALLLAGALALAGCTHPDEEEPTPGNGNNGSTDPDDDTITISGFAFHPQTKNVTLGTTLIWSNHDDTAHRLVADDESWAAGHFEPGQSDGVTFNDEGEFPYHCELHPQMTGTITVTR